jgi:hypothetical protein
MGGKKTSLLALLGACALGFLQTAAWAWQTTINGTANGIDVANKAAVDGTCPIVNLAIFGRRAGRSFNAP